MTNNENMEVIEAGFNELDLVADLFDKYRIFYKQPSSPEEGRKFIQERMENLQSVIFLALERQTNGVKPLGFVQLYPSFSSVGLKKLWILNDLYVDPSERRKGVAKILMQKAKDYAAETGAKGLTLETAADNHKAQRLYESIGYEKDEDHFYYHYSFR